MTDIKIISEKEIQFQKLLWHESEIVLARCYNFDVNIEHGIIIANITTTVKRALYEFIKVCFHSFSEAVSEEYRRNYFYEEVDKMYAKMDAYIEEFITHIPIGKTESKVPYYEKLYTHQKDVIKETFFKKHNLLALSMGLGKAQPLFSNLITPDGIISMGDVKMGQEVISSDGKPCKVIGIYPQGEIDYYKVTFSDGTHTFCCEDHLWIVKKINDSESRSWRIKSTKELIGNLIIQTKDRPLNNWKIPKTKPVFFNESGKKTLHPYLLGVMLGDGCMVSTLSISTNDHDELIPLIMPMLPEGMTIKKQKGDNYSWSITKRNHKMGDRNPMINMIRELGLFDLRSHDKFIPNQYLFTNADDRLELLKGLMDTDGHVSKEKSRISITTVSEKMRDGIMFLVQSLGGTATIILDRREGRRDCYAIHIVFDNDIVPFKLTRRLERYKPKKRILQKKITAIDYVGKTECQCIKVDSKDSSYLTDSFIVTHNTISAATISRLHSIPRTLIICPAAVKWNWYRDLKGWGYNELYFTIYDASKKRTRKAMLERFVIINFDIVGKYMDEINKGGHIGHFIIDECHQIKSTSAIRSKNIAKIVGMHENTRISLLSGTPIKNRVDDVFNYLKLTNHPLGVNYKKFTDENTIKTNSRGGERVTGGRNLEDLYRKMMNFMIRKTKEECLDLPGKIFLSYRFELDDYRDEYNKIIEELSQQKEISALTGNLHSLNIITSKAKIKGIIELANDIIESGKKVVIFGSYKEPLNMLEQYYRDKCVKIDGSVPSYERDTRIQKFINDEHCTVFLGNMQAAGVGINLTNSSDMIFLNFPLTPAELYQATDRQHRIGQSKVVNIHYTFCEESIDEYIYDIILDKEKDINTLIDRGKDVVLRENMTELLMKKLLKRDTLNLEDTKEEPIIVVPEVEVKERLPKPNYTLDFPEL
jgi:superfamily II DNA or RNA helicase